jgi:dTMP kinase
MASRAELVDEQVWPALARGDTVLLDRFFLATYAYQVGGRGLPDEAVLAANSFATGGLVPDLTILLHLPAAVGLARAAGRGGQDRIEREGREFHERVERAFATFLDPEWQRTHPEAGPIVAVSGEGTEDAVFGRVLAAVARRWPETFTLSGESHRGGPRTVD